MKRAVWPPARQQFVSKSTQTVGISGSLCIGERTSQAPVSEQID